MTLTRRFACTLLALVPLACDAEDAPGQDAPAGCEGGKCDDADADAGSKAGGVCVAVRGNGPLITSHFGAMARIVEAHGPVSGVAGGSSGSITSFLTESIHGNPLLYDCRDEVDYAAFDHFEIGAVADELAVPATVEEGRCTDAQTRARAALLYKSLLGYAEALGDSGEALALQHILALRGANDAVDSELEGELDEETVDEGQEEEPLSIRKLRDAIRGALDLLGSEDLRDILTLDDLLFALGRRPFTALALGRDLVGAIRDAAAFEPADHRMFIRPGIIDFEQVGSKLGRLASFYAGPRLRAPISQLSNEGGPLQSGLMNALSNNGYGPYWELTAVENGVESFDRDMRTFLNECAEVSVGETWHQLRDRAAGGSSCGQLLTSLATEYRGAFIENEDDYNNRADDSIGTFGRTRAEITTIATTGVLATESAIESFEASTDAWWDTAEVPAELWTVTMRDPARGESDVRLGYWGTDDTLASIESQLDRGPQADIKSKLYLSLGQATWGEILSASPAEPGLAAGVELSSRTAGGTPMISVGGWSDPHPTMVLEATGRCDSIAYITKRGEEGTFARGVQAELGGESLEAAFYDLDDPSSSVNASLRAADEVVCTDWDDYSPTDVAGVFADGYTNTVFTGAAGESAIRGCSPR